MPALRSILVRAPNWLGDCVMALPALAALREAQPQARLDVAARPSVAPLFHWAEGVGGVVTLAAGAGLRGLGARWRAAGALRGAAYEAALLLPNSFSSAVEMWRAGAARRVGRPGRGRGLLLTDPVPLGETVRRAHQADWYLHLAAALGADPAPRQPRLVPPRGLPQPPPARPAPEEPYAILAPGSAYGPAKDWPAGHFAALARRLREEAGLRVLVTGTPADAPRAEAIAAESGHAGDGVASVAGTTDLSGFLLLLAGAAGFVGNDSGAAHCAAALGLPTVVLFGSTEPGRTRPLGPRVRCLTGTAPCAPCLRRRCPRRDEPVACLASITPEAAGAALRALMGREEAAS
jgi:heptosyltransferase-2